MARDDPQLSAAKRAYKNAAAEGNRQEEARWANMIGDILKNKGEYVEALKWLRIDYDISIKCLPEKHLLPTCQSLGEVYLRLNHFGDALIYQKKHLELAKDSSDLIEQQRASTQLGRTYHEMFLKSEDDHYAVRNAKKYFKSAMKLALMLKENPPSNKSSFLEEFIDAHNNIGMLEMDLDNLEEAHKILTKGLEICDEEEVTEDDAKRSRLHHNLGSVYTELRMWDKAREHIEKDIIICKRIGHCQGEAKGYINLGELHYKVQKYEEALLCYQKALDLARSMEDEDALADQIDQNIDVVKEAIKVMGEMKKEEQNLKKLTRNMVTARGTPGERKCLLQQSASLDRLIDKSSMISAWKKHCEFAKRKKRIAKELCDKEKESDSFLVIGESYQKLRIFSKALKWYKKSWEIYKSIGNLEGQALVKVNIGDVLDCDGDWVGALDAFEEGYRIAVEANLPSVQLSALENMHYSNMIRFDNVDEARRLQLLIDNLKQSKNRELEAQNSQADCCSETDTEGDSHISNSRSNVHSSPKMSKSNSSKTNSFTSIEELRDDAPLISFIQPGRNFPKLKTAHVAKNITSTKPSHASPKSLSKSTGSQQTAVGRKRGRVVLLSDDEDEMHDEAERSRGRLHNGPVEDVATSDERRGKNDPASPACDFKEVSPVGSKCAISSCTPVNLEESTSSYKSRGPKIAAHLGKDFRSSSTDDVAIASSSDQCMTFKIDNDLIHVEAESREAESWMVGDSLNFESMKVEVACLYYLQLPMEKRSKGLLPIIQHMTCGGRPLESLEGIEMLKDYVGRGWIEVYVDGWVQKRLMKLYVDCCKELSETPNMKLLKKLYNLEVSEDEIIVSECDLQDLSITPLLNALQTHKTVALLDLSHNLLGNGTMEKLQEVFISSGQKYGGLVLDLHSNRFGPTALFQICECPVLFARLEVLNISWNRLTDACGSCLSTILENCKALYSLNIESCSITSRTIQKIADSLNDGSALSQFSFGYNNSISGNAIINLLAKLSTLKRFSELNMSGLKLNKPVVDSLCQLAKASCLSGLLLGGTNIGIHGALQLFESLFTGTQELGKLDLSHCGLTSQFITRLDTDVTLISTLLELNLGGNPIKQEGCNALASLLANPQCYLKTLTLNKCQLGLSGVIQIVQALASNESLEELNLAQNADLTLSAISPCGVNTGCNQLQVADSEEDDDSIRAEPVYDMSSGCRFIQEISIGIGAAKWLKLLDLSGNGFSTQIVEMFYTAWCSRGGLCQRHVKEQMVHFSVEGVKCCGVKPCCRRDLNL